MFLGRWMPAMVFALASVFLAGCALQPQPLNKAMELPSDWMSEGERGWPNRDWWQAFGSDELETLLLIAEHNNPDLAAAAARLLQAEAQARISGAALLPSADLSLSAARQGVISETSRTGYGLSLGASYEVDFWGRNRATRDAAQAAFDASLFDHETVALTLSSSVANSYLQLLSLRARLDTAQLNLANAERVLAVVDARVRNGAAPRLDLAQQLSTVARQRAAIPPLEQQARDTLAALAVLLGQFPQGFKIDDSDFAALSIPDISAGLPSELLTRRPDIRRAEAQLLAGEANLVAARAALLPSIRLSASSGVQSGSLSSLFDGNPAYNLSAGILQPIFEGGRLRAQRDLSDARRMELLQNYRATVLDAFADVELALSDIHSLAEQARYQHEELTQAQLAFELAEARYRAGATDLLTVLDAQRSLYNAEDQSRQLQLLRLQAAITLYRVMGGGWEKTG